MGFDDRLWIYLVEEHDAHLTAGPAPPSGRRRPALVRGAAAGVVVLAAAVVVLVLVSSGGAGSSAWSAQVLRAAEIMLPKPAPNTILHVSVTQAMTPAARQDTVNTAVPTVDAEGWFQQGGPSRWVTRETVPGGTPVWQSDTAVYDPAAHRLYVDPPLPGGHPHYTLTKTDKDGSYTLGMDGPHGPVRQTVTAAEARALRSGADQISWSETWNGHKAALQPMIWPTGRFGIASQVQQPNDTSLSFPAQLHRLLESGHAHVDGRVTVDDRAAIKIEIPGAHQQLWMTYYVDPTTYRPMELDSYGFGNPKDVTRLLFHSYQQLPLKSNARLLGVHPTAGTTVDHSATGYFQHLPPPLFW